ncbi:GNAT family N-acetyltransferase [Bacillus tianshenii]|nr:GNAT family N-acetyltransferase [Bacillus tianshenii]
MRREVTIRKLETIEDLKGMQEIQRSIWSEGVIPLHQTMTVNLNGGLIIGAFHEEKIIGFSYGFPGFQNQNVYLCSHVLGIHPDYQRQGIGSLLKQAQKEMAIKLGYTSITWTYDPLESVNGYLNLSKLGAICSTYVENCYGKMEDTLNYGMPTDRFKVEWHVRSSYVNNRIDWNKRLDNPVMIANYEKLASGQPMLTDQMLFDEQTIQQQEQVLIPCPTHIQQLKQADFSLALDWRMKVRKAFQMLFGNGFAAVHIQKTDTPVHYYLAVKQASLPLQHESEESICN